MDDTNIVSRIWWVLLRIKSLGESVTVSCALVHLTYRYQFQRTWCRLCRRGWCVMFKFKCSLILTFPVQKLLHRSNEKSATLRMACSPSRMNKSTLLSVNESTETLQNQRMNESNGGRLFKLLYWLRWLRGRYIIWRYGIPVLFCLHLAYSGNHTVIFRGQTRFLGFVFIAVLMIFPSDESHALLETLSKK